MSDWQPIETAPFTSRAILVWCPERRNAYCVTWDKTDNQWYVFGHGKDLSLEPPSHWMPLPEPPAA